MRVNSFAKMEKWLYRLALFAYLMCASTAAIYAGERRLSEFPIPEIVEEQRKFWVKIFAVYGSHQIIIHDKEYPNIVIDVIDFNAFSKKFNGDRPYTTKQKQEVADAYIARYEKAVERFVSYGRSASEHSAMEKRIESVYSKFNGGMQQVLRGAVAFRAQTGLTDSFKKAAAIAHDYLPYMERIFAHYKIPTELTRIAFVESMFNVKARSKVGASGIWQFMPSTAKQFMVVNRLIDERNSPLKATAGAAQLLRHNYKRLGSWPLAVTAYNHGAGGMRRAVRQVGSKDISDIIKSYKSNTFGFASKNFYAEFLAAKDVFNGIYAEDTRKESNPLDIVNLKLKKPVSLHQLVKYTPLDEHTIKRLNLCLSDKIFRKYRYRPLPTNFELIIPKSKRNRTKLALNKIRVSKVHNKGFKL